MQISPGIHFVFLKVQFLVFIPLISSFLQRLLFHCIWVLLPPTLCLYLSPSSALCSKIHCHNFFLSYSSSYPSSVMPKHCTTDLQQTQLLCSFSGIFSISFGPVIPLCFHLCSRELHWACSDSISLL